MTTGISLRLLISSASKSSGLATSILMAVLIFQFLFAGVLFDLRGKVAEPLSYFSPTRWSVTALGVTLDMNRIAQSTIVCSEVHENPSDPNSKSTTICSNTPNAKNDLSLNYANDQLGWSWIALIGMTILCWGITWLLLARQEPTILTAS
jgi:hypothetical protein